MTTLGLRPPPLPALGAPGVYLLPEVAPPALVAEPLDVAAFVGVAPRGAAWEAVDDPTLLEAHVTLARSVAVPVDSWDDYVHEFGAFEGPGLLPHAVATFFAQGGRRAFVVRIVHDEHGWESGRAVPLGCAHHDVGLPGVPDAMQPLRVVGGGRLRLRARNEGSWGDRLTITMRFTARPLAITGDAAQAIVLAAGARLPVGSLVRVHGAAGEVALRWIRAVETRGRAHSSAVDRLAVLDAPAGFAIARVEEVLADLEVIDRDPARVRTERFAGLGLDPSHPTWLAGELARESRLVVVAAPVDGLELRDVTAPDLSSTLVPSRRGADRWESITPHDFFGRVLLGDESGTEGLDALLGAPEVASVVVPDLYSPAPLPVAEVVTIDGVFAGPDFAPCLEREPMPYDPPRTTGLTGLRLDPTIAAELDVIIGLQQELVTTAERLQVVALLDVPPRLRRRAVLRWRARFDSSFAAAYHPWVRIPAGDAAGVLVETPPSAVAAGVIARCERRSGISFGPANEIAVLAVDVLDRISDAEHDELHPEGVNVLRRLPGGVWLTGARTLSSDRDLRQLTVRRLLMLIERAVGRQLLWTVFEPNDDALRVGLRRMVEHLLDELFARGAFAGATREESWFVDVATGPDAWREADRGEVVVRIGVAPSEPTEFILLRVVLDDDGAIRTAAQQGAGVSGRG